LEGEGISDLNILRKPPGVKIESGLTLTFGELVGPFIVYTKLNKPSPFCSPKSLPANLSKTPFIA